MIDNKYNLDEEVWIIDRDNNSIIHGRITKIIIDSTIKYDIYINLAYYDSKRNVDERFIHKSADECKEYIIKNINIFYNVVRD